MHLESLIDVLFCKLHYGFGGNRLSTLSEQVSFVEFICVIECTWFITLTDTKVFLHKIMQQIQNGVSKVCCCY